MDVVLMPCPLCDSSDLEFLYLEFRGYAISCTCGIELRRFELTEKEFLRLWNTRKKKSWL